MAGDERNFRTKITMKEVLKMDYHKAKEFIFGIAELNMRGNFYTVSETEEEF